MISPHLAFRAPEPSPPPPTRLSAQNEARNHILDHGRSLGARWILAFDGNQFFTAESWRALTSAVEGYDKKGLKVFKVSVCGGWGYGVRGMVFGV